MGESFEPSGARVVLYQLPSLMRAVVAKLVASDPGLTVAAEPQTEAGLRATMRDAGASVVICPLEDGMLPSACQSILSEPARIVVVGLSREGNVGTVHRLALQRVTLKDLSLDALLLTLHARSGPEGRERHANG